MRRMTDEFLAEIAQEVAEYNSSAGRGGTIQVAKKHDVSTRTVEAWLQKAYDRKLADRPSPGRSLGRISSPCPACRGRGVVFHASGG